MTSLNVLFSQFHVREILREPDFDRDRYTLYCLKKAVGVLYVTPASPQYLSGHVRLRGINNGQYPYRYKEMIDELFGPAQRAIEVCSGDVESTQELFTVDINPEKHPNLVADGQALPAHLTSQFDRWSCDPPYNHETAREMYDTKLPSFGKLLTEGARIVKAGSLLFFLIGNKNMQWCPVSLTRIGLIFCTIVPNQEVRALHIYLKS